RYVSSGSLSNKKIFGNGDIAPHPVFIRELRAFEQAAPQPDARCFFEPRFPFQVPRAGLICSIQTEIFVIGSDDPGSPPQCEVKQTEQSSAPSWVLTCKQMISRDRHPALGAPNRSAHKLERWQVVDQVD